LIHENKKDLTGIVCVINKNTESWIINWKTEWK